MRRVFSLDNHVLETTGKTTEVFLKEALASGKKNNEIADLLGVGAQVIRKRVNEYGLSKAVQQRGVDLDAITQSRYNLSLHDYILERKQSNVPYTKMAEELGVSINTFRCRLRKLGFLPIPDCMRKDTKEYAEAKSECFFDALSLPYINAENALWRKWHI